MCKNNAVKLIKPKKMPIKLLNYLEIKLILMIEKNALKYLVYTQKMLKLTFKDKIILLLINKLIELLLCSVMIKVCCLAYC